MKFVWNSITSTSAGAALGGLAGGAIFALLLNYSSALEVVQMMRIGVRAAPVDVILQTPAFANRLANKIGADPIDLMASQYGGRGHLQVRERGDGTLIELRSKARDPDMALKIVKVAGELAMADDRELIRPFRELFEQQLAEQARHRDRATSVANALSSTIQKGKNTDLQGVAAQVQITSHQMLAAQSSPVYPPLQDAMVVIEPLLFPPFPWWQALIIGVVAGGAMGFAAHHLQTSKSMTDETGTVEAS